jgi:hypothetical protein
VDAVEVRAGHRQAPRLGAGRQQQAVPGQRVAAGQGHGPAGRVDRLDGRPRAQVDVLLGVEALVVDAGLLALALAA